MLTDGCAADGAGVVLIRPRQIGLAAAPGVGTVRAEVVHCHFRGHDYRVEVAPDPGHGLPERLIAYSDAAPPTTGLVYLAAHGTAHRCPEA